MIPAVEIIAALNAIRTLALGIAELSGSDGYSDAEKDAILKAASIADDEFDARVQAARARLGID